MEMAQRGIVRNRVYYNQVKDFSGLLYGSITPTDFDMLIDFRNKVFIFGELKFGDVDLPMGQKLAFERLVDACERSGKYSLGIIAKHYTPPENDIAVANCTVTEYRFNNKWRKPNSDFTIRQMVDRFIAKYGIRY